MPGSKKIKAEPEKKVKVPAVPLSGKKAAHAAPEKKTAKTAVNKSSATKKKEVEKGVSMPPKVMKKDTTQDIQKEEPKPERLRELKNGLLKKRAEIVKEAKDEIAKYVSGENRQLVDTAVDEGDWAVVDISEDLNLMRLDAHRKLMLDIDEALRKINEGTYGICEDCGEEISEKRLGVMPTATLCISCKENKEQLEAISRQDVE